MFSTDSEMPIYEERKISKVHLIVSLILHIHHNNILYRFSDQVFIAHPETKKLLYVEVLIKGNTE